jgi:hypothetical protein
VSLPLTCEALAAAVDTGPPAALLASPEQAFERVAGPGDLFACVLTLAQQLAGRFCATTGPAFRSRADPSRATAAADGP